MVGDTSSTLPSIFFSPFSTMQARKPTTRRKQSLHPSPNDWPATPLLPSASRPYPQYPLASVSRKRHKSSPYSYPVCAHVAPSTVRSTPSGRITPSQHLGPRIIGQTFRSAGGLACQFVEIREVLRGISGGESTES